jgi:prepilin-type N-terminal cleavage/methylation domain-containing protein
VPHRLKQRQAGFTLTEIAIVLGIVGIILGAVWVAAKSVFDANKANQAAQDIITIASNIHATYLAANSFTGPITMTQWIAAGVVPSDLITSASSASNAWNGAVTITASPSGNNRAFRITYKGTPADACFRIASQLVNLGTNDAPFDFITNGGNPIPVGGGVSNANCTGVQISGLCSNAIYTACQNNGTGAGSSASTEFDFNIH